MLLGSFSFAWMSTIAHALGGSCDWRIIALTRSSLALLFATLLALAAGAPLVFLRPRILWLRSLAGSVSLVCTFYALPRLPVADVLTLTNTFPIWVAFLSWPLLREPPSARVWLAVLCGVIGVILIHQPEGNVAAMLLALVSSFSTAVAMMGLNRLQGVDTRAIVVHFSGVATAICLAAVFVGGPPPEVDGLAEWPMVFLLLAMGATATIGQLCLTRAFTDGSPAKVSVVGLTQIVFALALEVIFWNRACDSSTLLGIALVMGPTAWVMVRT
jgi:drug/metabolite transporter (DMT)-like permease